jgi:hypothetical protein
VFLNSGGRTFLFSLLHGEDIDGNLIQHINFELYNEEISSNRNSAIGEGTGKHSIFRKKMGTPDRHTLEESQFLNSLVPNVEHVINRLNQKDLSPSPKK